MISIKWKKQIRTLQQKKQRFSNRQFLVEGEKSVFELLLSDFEVVKCFISSSTFQGNAKLAEIIENVDFELVEDAEIAKLSSLAAHRDCIAIAKMKDSGLDVRKLDENGFYLALEDIRDPGNLGTIIRIADWYGVTGVFCSLSTVDFYNPKVISATMGSFTRIQPVYTNLIELANNSKLKIIGASLEGTSLHDVKLEKGSIVVLGNESSGISSELSKLFQSKISIPRFGGAESLNVAISSAIFCEHYRLKK